MNKALYTNMTGMRLLGSIKFQKCHVLLAQCFIVYKGLAHTFSNLILRETMGGELGIYHYPILQMSHPCVTIGKTMALTIWAFVSKVTALFFTEEDYRQ